MRRAAASGFPAFQPLSNMQHFVSLFAVVSLAAVASAQSTVLPNGYDTTEGNSSSA